MDKELQYLEELKRRREARADLNKWAIAVNDQEPPALHHRFLNGMLEKVERGEIRKLMVWLPPGAAKSTYCSVNFPPVFLARKERRAILACSHSANLADSFGRRCRNLVDAFQNVLGYALAKDSKAADNWHTTNRGEYRAAGVGMKIAGFRGDLGLIDDPVGSKEDAESLLTRDNTWQWYNYDFLPRLKPNASQIIIQTRWHEDDLSGRILARESSEWVVISIPLIAVENDPLGRQPGQLLWPEYFNQTMVEQAKKEARVFNSLYQQNPTPEDGNYFTADSIQTYEPHELPKELRKYAGSDHAVSQKQEADLTCLMVGGVDESDNLYILPDLVWDKLPSDVAVEKMLDIAESHRPIEWWAEKGHISASIGPFLTKRMVERGVYIPITEVTSNRDKATRAQSIKARMRQGKVFFPVRAPWWDKALHQLLSFPVGTHDDFVDALSEIGQGLDRTTKAPVAVVEVENKMPGLPTMKWIKESSNRIQREREYALLDK